MTRLVLPVNGVSRAHPHQVDPGPEALATPAASRIPAILQTWLSGRSAETLEAYRADLRHFAAWSGAPRPEDALGQLLAHGHGPANEIALRYRGALLDAGLAPATINRRLSALRSVVKIARKIGAVAWALEVESVASRPYRDTRGPPRATVKAVLSADVRPRDRAILRLLADLALRRVEIARLDRAHVETDPQNVPTAIRVSGKGRRGELETLRLPAQTAAALRAWLDQRGDSAGPLFVPMSNRGEHPQLGRRMHVNSVANLVAAAGESVGAEVRCHGLRHAAVTRALDVTDGDVRRVRRFSRHASVETVLVYDDNREDAAGAIAREVAEW